MTWRQAFVFALTCAASVAAVAGVIAAVAFLLVDHPILGVLVVALLFVVGMTVMVHGT